MSKFLPSGGLKWIDPKYFDWNKYSSNSSKVCVLEVVLEYPKELRESNNEHALASDKIKIKKELLLLLKKWSLTFLIKKSTCIVLHCISLFSVALKNSISWLIKI